MIRLIAAVIVALLLVPGVAQSQQTQTGRAEPGFLYRYACTPAAPGQLLATLSWDSSSAQLALILVCTVDGRELGFGVASGLIDRFARLEAGVLSNPCEIGVLTATGSANFVLNLQRSGPESSSGRPPMSLGSTVTRSVIPGTARGALLDQMAFTLQGAIVP